MSLLTVFLPLLTSALFIVAATLVNIRALAPFVIVLLSLMPITLATDFSRFCNGFTSVTALGTWASSGLFEIQWNFAIDALTYTMLIVVLVVSVLVHLYSTEYMSEDPHLPRFISYLSLFTFFMLVLISSDNFVTLFLGWEGVGLCSYLLISFWQTRVQANKAAIKAMVVNRVADLTFTVGILTTFYVFQTIDFSTVFGLAPYLSGSTLLFGNFTLPALTTITMLLFFGAMGKSAQIGLHTWLPDAMEGPTPVSALIHAATMVTSGIFLLVRCSPLFEEAPATLLFVTLIGATTAFMAATAGLVQNDIKKVIAYSTCSQLGYMAFACGLSHYAVSLFHLANHAFFKALLFLSAGAVIHSISSEQDLRRFGGLLKLLPYTYAAFLVGSLALMGFPFLTGFYSKDLILELSAAMITIPGTFAYWLGLITALFTAYYSFRLIYLAFYGTSRSPRPYLLHAHELTPRMAFALFVLALGAIFFGYMTRDIFVGFGTPFWNGTIYHAPQNVGAQLAGEFLPLTTKLAPLIGSAGSLAVLFHVVGPLAASSYTNPAFNPELRALNRFLSHKWYFDTVYNRVINQPLMFAAYTTVFKNIDRGLVEYFGPTGAAKLLVRIGRKVTAMQSGSANQYALVLFNLAFVMFFLF